MTPYQVNVAAESLAAAVFSHAGYDVAMQYGTTQPNWDLVVKKGERVLEIQVKGSQERGWGLFQSYLKGADYHGAVSKWAAAQPQQIVYFLVSFHSVLVGEFPRCYIARPHEILAHMKQARGGHGITTLREKYSYTKGVGAGHTDKIPDCWQATRERIDTV